jgi:hypothetical protein
MSVSGGIALAIDRLAGSKAGSRTAFEQVCGEGKPGTQFRKTR